MDVINPSVFQFLACRVDAFVVMLADAPVDKRLIFCLISKSAPSLSESELKGNMESASAEMK